MKNYILFLSLLFLFSCTPTTTQQVVSSSTTMINSQDLKIPCDGKTDAHNALQRYINDAKSTTVRLEKGDYYISKSIIVPSGKIIEGSQANIYYKGSDVAFYIGKGSINWRSSIENLNIFISGRGAKAIDASWARAFNMSNCVIQLKEQDQVGIYMKGHAGKAPYQNTFTTSYISGDISKKNQTGILLEDGEGKATASGPNRNIFNNFKQIASLTTGVDIRAGDGNIFSDLNTENITKYHFKLNDIPPVLTTNATGGKLSTINCNVDLSKYQLNQVKVISGTNAGYTSKIIFKKKNVVGLERPAAKPFDATSKIAFYESKATNNIISNTASEARNTACFAKLCMGANGNYFKNNYMTSIGTTKFERECEENSNQIGEENYIVFALSNVGANKKTSMTSSGGFVMPFSGFISGVTISGSNTSKKGSGEVLIKTSGKIIKELTTSLVNGRNISSTSFLKKFDTSQPSFAKAGQRVTIELLTKGKWNPKSEVMVGILLTRL